MELKPKLIKLIQHAYQEEQTFVDKLSEQERSAQGESDQWAPKDVINHLAGWKLRLADNLEAAANGGTPVRYDNYLEINDQEFEDFRDRPWSEIWDRAGEAQQALLAQIEARDEETLRGTDTLPWQGELPLWRYFVGTGYVHSLAMHLAPLYIARGDAVYSTKLAEEAVPQLLALDDAADWHGVVHYNLACQYAQTDEKEKAIQQLRQAFELNSNLIEGSKQDSDLASIHQDPAYLALCAQ